MESSGLETEERSPLALRLQYRPMKWFVFLLYWVLSLTIGEADAFSVSWMYIDFEKRPVAAVPVFLYEGEIIDLY